VRESEIARRCDAQLRAAGWLVIVTSQDKSTRRQLAGLPDRIAIRHGYCVFVEYKSPGGELRHSQLDFYGSIAPHLGEYLRYYVIDNPDYGIPQWMLE
jgi:hypothetical protein